MPNAGTGRAGGWTRHRLQITDWRWRWSGMVMDICQWLLHDSHEQRDEARLTQEAASYQASQGLLLNRLIDENC